MRTATMTAIDKSECLTEGVFLKLFFCEFKISVKLDHTNCWKLQFHYCYFYISVLAK